jgi:hypothetical protein
VSDFNALDLDSLDALLDAAEVEVATAAEVESKQNESETVAEDLTSMEVKDARSGEAEDLAAPVPEQVTVPDPNASDGLAIEPAAMPEFEAAASHVTPPEDELPLKSEISDRPERDFNSTKKPKQTEAWTEAEMDSIKKLIIIFGSVTIVLVLGAIGVGLGGLFATPKPDTTLIEKIDEIKNDVGQSYLLVEDAGKQAKTMSGQLSDVATQLADIAESIEQIKSKPVVSQAPQNAPTKVLSAAERKAAMREEAQAHEEVDAEDAGGATDKQEKPVNSAQVTAISADISDVKKRLIATQKLLETIQKQSEALQLQSQVLTDTVKSVETEVKAHKSVAKASSVPKPVVAKKATDDKAAAPTVVQVKPADDPQWRARWSQQMGKSDGFP